MYLVFADGSFYFYFQPIYRADIYLYQLLCKNEWNQLTDVIKFSFYFFFPPKSLSAKRELLRTQICLRI